MKKSGLATFLGACTGILAALILAAPWIADDPATNQKSTPTTTAAATTPPATTDPSTRYDAYTSGPLADHMAETSELMTAASDHIDTGNYQASADASAKARDMFTEQGGFPTPPDGHPQTTEIVALRDTCAAAYGLASHALSLIADAGDPLSGGDLISEAADELDDCLITVQTLREQITS